MRYDPEKEYEGAMVHEDGTVSDEGFHAEMLASQEGNAASREMARRQFNRLGIDPLAVLPPADSLVTDLQSLGKSAVREHQIDFVLQEEFLANTEFLGQFLALCQGRQQFVDDSATALEALSSVRDETGETDVLVSYQLASDSAGTRRVLLIENKVDAVFGKKQAERYQKRGNNGIAVRQWTSFVTCLVAPRAYIKPAHGFDCVVALEDLFPYLAPRDAARQKAKQSIFELAIKEQARQGLKEEDHVVTEFRRRYFYAFQEFSSKLPEPDKTLLEDVLAPVPHRAWWDDTWFEFRSPSFGPRIYINHKTHRKPSGAVDLTFRNTQADDLRAQVTTEPEMEILQTGKSAAVRLTVPFIDCHKDFDEQHSSLMLAFKAVLRLVAFLKAHPQLSSLPKRSEG